MKKLLLLCLVMTTFFACSSDDDTPSVDEKVIGTWKISQISVNDITVPVNTLECLELNRITFEPNGVLTIKSFEANNNDECIEFVDSGSWINSLNDTYSLVDLEGEETIIIVFENDNQFSTTEEETETYEDPVTGETVTETTVLKITFVRE